MECGKKPEKRPVPSVDKALQRMASLCARSEQCEHEIRTKLAKAGMAPEDAERVLGRLRELGFVDDARYARSLARDKVRFSGWGRDKIRVKLMTKRIAPDITEEALRSIDPADYKEALLRSARAKARTLDLKESDGPARLARHLTGRGFEYKYVSRLVAELRRRLEQ